MNLKVDRFRKKKPTFVVLLNQGLCLSKSPIFYLLAPICSGVKVHGRPLVAETCHSSFCLKYFSQITLEVASLHTVEYYLKLYFSNPL